MNAHGTTTSYTRGCRCAECRAANARSKAAYRAGRRAGDPLERLRAAIPQPASFERAACRDHPTDWWFPEPGDLHGKRLAKTPETRRALSICRVCPVRAACLRFALESNEVTGIWGGTTGAERRRMRSRQTA